MCVCIRVCVCTYQPSVLALGQPNFATTTHRCLTMEHGTLKCCRGHVFAGHQKEAKDCSEALGPGPFRFGTGKAPKRRAGNAMAGNSLHFC